jgi:hypothetical protein
LFEKILLICIFTAMIHLIETLSYSVRIAGVRTARLATALSLFNMIVIVSRTANMVQAPMAGGLVDHARATGEYGMIEEQFRLIIVSASLGTVLGMILIPSFVLIFARAIMHLEQAGSVPQMLRNIATIQKLRQARHHLRRPKWWMIHRIRLGGVPKRFFLFNALVTAIYTVGVLAALYASLLTPEHASAVMMSSGLINGIATILMVIFVDPKVALITDQVLHGQKNPNAINKMVGILTFSKLLGTLLAQALFIPAAYWITVVTGLLT